MVVILCKTMLIGSNKSDTRTFDNTGVLRPLLNIIRKHKPLTKEEELVKFALYKKGDRKAGEEKPEKPQ